MAGSTFGSTVTSLVVFVPVIFLPGVIGALFRDLALAVCFSLFASFIVSITLVPVLYYLTGSLRPAAKLAKEKRVRRKPLAGIEKVYRRALRFALRRPL